MKTELQFVQDEIAGLHAQTGKREAKPFVKCDKAPEGKCRHSWKLSSTDSRDLQCQYCGRHENEVKAVPEAKGRYTKDLIERINRLEEIQEQIQNPMLKI